MLIVLNCVLWGWVEQELQIFKFLFPHNPFDEKIKPFGALYTICKMENHSETLHKMINNEIRSPWKGIEIILLGYQGIFSLNPPNGFLAKSRLGDEMSRMGNEEFD